MKINTGQPVTGTDFFNRERELQRMDETLKKADTSLFIPGPRRIGKSSLVKEFMRRKARAYEFIYFDLESRKTITELCNDLARSIKEKFPRIIKENKALKQHWNILAQMIPELKLGGLLHIKTQKIDVSEKELMDSIEKILIILKKQGLILVFDEFSDFLINLSKTDQQQVHLFLEWLRRLRQEQQIQFIITGSVNVLSTAEKFNVLGLLNDLTDLEILALGKNATRELLISLLAGKSITLETEVLDFCLEKLNEGIPFYIQLFADLISYYSGGSCCISDLDEIRKYYRQITASRHKEFEYFHQRLRKLLSNDQFKAARKILIHTVDTYQNFDDLIAIACDSLNDNDSLAVLLQRLVDECYLKITDNKYTFVSRMLADWWINRYTHER